MLALDTNIVVRYLTGDHPQQSAKARNLVDKNQVFVCTTVILEAEWVLRSAYKFGAKQIVGALMGFAGLPNVTLEEPETVAMALASAEQGVDFADACIWQKRAGATALQRSTDYWRTRLPALRTIQFGYSNPPVPARADAPGCWPASAWR
jgi:predicted nucleic-acid-binding protein